MTSQHCDPQHTGTTRAQVSLIFPFFQNMPHPFLFRVCDLRDAAVAMGTTLATLQSRLLHFGLVHFRGTEFFIVVNSLEEVEPRLKGILETLLGWDEDHEMFEDSDMSED